MTKTFKVPWAAWREPKYLDLTFPDSWDISIFKMKGADAPELTDEKIRNSILNPIATPKLSELAKNKEKIVIVVDDMTRTTPIYKILPHILGELDKVGITKEQITILLAIGAHKPMNRHDCILKLGKYVVENFNIENHHPYENLINLGESKIGTPIEVNRTYYNSDLRIAIGGVIPHILAGFGGGAKIVLPGVCGIRTLEANHSAGFKFGSFGGGIGKVTKIREDIEDIVETIGLDFSINVILNEIGDICGIFSGHFKEAHRKAIELAKKYYKTNVSVGNHICFFNLYPEDSELNQAIKGFNFLITAPSEILDSNGVIILMSSSYEGRGYHSLLAETGSRLFHNFGNNLEKGLIWKVFVKKRKVFFFSPNINEADLYHFFPKSIKLFHNWEKLLRELENTYGNSPKAALFPCSIQLAQ